MIITSPLDLSGGGGSTPDIPVILLATFYITGGDGLQPPDGGPTCQNDPFPGTGRSNFAVWGHWMKYANPGVGNGNACKANEFGDCVPQLVK